MKNIYSLILMFSVMVLSAQTKDQLSLYSVNSGKDFICTRIFYYQQNTFHQV
jgi:hypothetical protein